MPAIDRNNLDPTTVESGGQINSQNTLSLMVDYLHYSLSMSSQTRATDAISWETSKLVDLILKDASDLYPKENARLRSVVRRIQDKDGKWAIIQYRVWPKDRPAKMVRLAMCQQGFRDELDERQGMAKLVSTKISEILYDTDPADLAAVDAPKDEYDPEAEWIAERIFVGREEVSPGMLKEVFESMFSKGVGEDVVYEKAAKSLRPIIQEHINQLESSLREAKNPES